jgi:hypothetical protein
MSQVFATAGPFQLQMTISRGAVVWRDGEVLAIPGSGALVEQREFSSGQAVGARWAGAGGKGGA